MIEELECLRKDEKFLKKTMNEISFSKHFWTEHF